MKASQFSDAQKAFILKQGADGMPVAEICRKAGISQATYFNWKKKYDGLLPTEMRRLKQLEDENNKLTARGADLSASTRRCCRTSSAENSEACPEAQAGGRGAWRVGRVDPAGLPGAASSTRRPTTTSLVAPDRPCSNNGSRRSARRGCAMAIGAFTCCCAAKDGGSTRRRRVSGLSRVRPAIAQQDAQAPGQGQAAGGPQAGDASERDLGDGLRA